jgi:plastocyanin
VIYNENKYCNFYYCKCLSIVSGGLIIFLSFNNNPSTSPNPLPSPKPSDTPLQSPVQTSSNSGSETKTFVITGENFKFKMNSQDNPDIQVNSGNKVIIKFSSIFGLHDFVVDEFNAKTTKVNDGQSISVLFVASKKGTYEYYCSVGEHRAMGKHGRFIVN